MTKTAVKNSPVQNQTTETATQTANQDPQLHALRDLSFPKSPEIAPLTEKQFLDKHSKVEIGQTTMYVTVA